MDTLPNVSERQHEFHKTMDGEKRLEIASSMFDSAREIVKSSLFYRNPRLSESELKVELFLRMYGEDFDRSTCDKIVKKLRMCQK